MKNHVQMLNSPPFWKRSICMNAKKRIILSCRSCFKIETRLTIATTHSEMYVILFMLSFFFQWIIANSRFYFKSLMLLSFSWHKRNIFDFRKEIHTLFVIHSLETIYQYILRCSNAANVQNSKHTKITEKSSIQRERAITLIKCEFTFAVMHTCQSDLIMCATRITNGTCYCQYLTEHFSNFVLCMHFSSERFSMCWEMWKFYWKSSLFQFLFYIGLFSFFLFVFFFLWM